MNIFDRIAQRFCRWRKRKHIRRADKAKARSVIWSERELRVACKHLIVGRPNTKNVSDPPFLPPLDQRAREAGA